MSSSRRTRSRSASPGRKDPREDSFHKDKKHKGSHRRSSKDSDLVEQAKKFLQPITEDDYYTKSNEFRLWLRESKNKYFDELDSEQARAYFKKFVNAWNKFKLEKKYYDGIRSSQIDKSDRTRYKWVIQTADDLGPVKKEVDRQTNKVVVIKNEENEDEGRRIIGPTMPPPLDVGNVHSYPRNINLPLDMDDEDRRRYERSLRKKEAKDYAKTQEAVLDELLPKATGREAMIEKKKARNEHYRREASPELELDDDALLGGDDFRSRLAARDRAKAAREDRKQQYKAEKAANVQEKIVAYKSKEQETMEMFRKIAEEQKKAGGGLWGESRGNG